VFAFIHDVPATPAMYARLKELLGPADPPGLVVHLAFEQPDGTLRYVDVWESEAAWNDFGRTRLGAAVATMLAEFGVTPPGRPDPVAGIPVVDVWIGAADLVAG
jgi:hypothetical protein